MATGELIVAPPLSGGDVVASDFMPVLTVAKALERKETMNEFIAKVMRVDEDYGIIPGTKKPTLLKPGAEKLCSMFGLTPQYTADSIIEDWTGEAHGGEPMFYYSYRCSLSRGGRFMGEAIGSCSSWESKYRHRWVREDQLGDHLEYKATLPSRGGKRTVFEPQFAIDKAETTGRFGKPTEYWQKFRDAEASGAPQVERKLGQKGPYKGWEITIDELQYRIPNPDMADNVNTIQKMAQKRALLAAVLIVTNASDAFTQDLEDSPDYGREHAATVPRQEGSGSISSGGELFGIPEDDDDPRNTPAPVPGPSVNRSPQQNQQVASQAQFEQAQQTRERPIPEELTDLFKRIDKGEKEAVPRAFKLMDSCFKELNCPPAGKEYEDIKVKYRNQFPTGGAKKANGLDIKVCLLDMWDALKRGEQYLELTRGQQS